MTACLVGIRKGFKRKITFKLVVGEEQRVSEDGQAVGTDVQKF